MAPGAELEGVGGSQQAGDQSSVRGNNLMLRCPEIARTALLFTSLPTLDGCKRRTGLSELSGSLLVPRV